MVDDTAILRSSMVMIQHKPASIVRAGRLPTQITQPLLIDELLLVLGFAQTVKNLAF
jgi:hypothetical protein